MITHTGILRLTSTVSNDSLGLDTWSRIVNPASVCILPRTVSGSIQNVKSNSIEIKNSTFKKDYAILHSANCVFNFLGSYLILLLVLQ